jgi:uncharacterized membrane protein YiaA
MGKFLKFTYLLSIVAILIGVWLADDPINGANRGSTIANIITGIIAGIILFKNKSQWRQGTQRNQLWNKLHLALIGIILYVIFSITFFIGGGIIIGSVFNHPYEGMVIGHTLLNFVCSCFISIASIKAEEQKE